MIKIEERTIITKMAESTVLQLVGFNFDLEVFDIFYSIVIIIRHDDIQKIYRRGPRVGATDTEKNRETTLRALRLLWVLRGLSKN